MPSNEKFLPFGMSTLRFRATPDKADIIQNLVVSEEGTLKAITGPTLYEPKDVWVTAPADLGRVHSIWHGYFNNGKKEVLIAHAGFSLWVHWGAVKGWRQLFSPRILSNDSEVVSGFVPFNNGLIFFDGKGPPLFVNNQLDVQRLGFSDVPSPPVVRGPESATQTETKFDGEGTFGYSWHGGLGSPGDRLNGEDPHILKGAWSYKCQYESYTGDLSALSEVSADILYGPKKSKGPRSKTIRAIADAALIPAPGTTLRNLTRGAAVIVPDNVPSNTKFVRILRTKDTERNETDYYVAWKAPATGGVIHDWKFDAGLTIKAEEVTPIPSFSAATTYRGSLVIIDGADVRISEAGFPGTFASTDRLTITADGQQGTAVFALGGRLFAATDRSIVDCTDFSSPVAVSDSIGVAGPRCWTYAPGIGVVFVSASGVYGLTSSGAETSITKLSTDVENLWLRDINRSKLRTAVVWYSKKRDEVRIAVPKKGKVRNTLILAFSQAGWRKYDLGLEINCFAYADELELVGGTDNRTISGQGYTADDVYVLERESTVYTPPSRKVVYESDYEPVDESLGAIRGKILDLYVCFVETHASEAAQVELFSNFETEPDETFILRLDDVPGNDLQRKAAWGQSIVGTDKLHNRRVVWRKVRAAVREVQRFKFRITTDYPNGPELIAAMYKFVIPAQAGTREPDFQET